MAITEMIVLAAKNQTSAMWSQIEGDAKRTANTVVQASEQMNKGMKVAGAGLTAFGAAGTALITSSTLLAARVETLGAVLNTVGNTAGYTNDQLAAFEEGIKSQGITTQAARQTLIKLAQANIDLSNATDLARIAQNAAVIAGVNSSEAYDRMIHGITTLNPLILRHMGLIVDAQAEYKKYADQMGISTQEITAAQKQQIFMNAVMEAGTKIAGAYESAMETAGKKLTSLPRHIEEAKLAFGEAFLPVMVQVVDTVTAAFKAFNNLSDSSKSIVSWATAAGTALAAMLGPMLLIVSKLPGIISGIATFGTGLQTFMVYGLEATTVAGKLSTAFTMLGGATAGLLATMASTAVLVSWAIALGMIVKTAIDVKKGFDMIEEKFVTLEDQTAKSANTWEDYVDEMARLAVASRSVSPEVAKIAAEQAKQTGTLDALHEAMSMYGDAVDFLTQSELEALVAGRALEAQDQKMITVASRIQAERKKQAEGYYDQVSAIGNLIVRQDDLFNQFNYGQISGIEYAESLREISAEINRLGVGEELGEAYEGFLKLGEAEELNRQITEALNRELGTLNALVEGQVGKAIEQHKGKVDELAVSEANLKSEIAALNEKQEKQGWLSKKDQENLSNLKEELNGVEAALKAENAAWEENAKRLMFDLAQRQLLADGIQEGDVAALGAVAESLGLVDENTAIAFSGLDTLGSMLANGETNADGYAEGVSQLAQNLANLPDEKTVTIWLRTIATGGSDAIPGVTNVGKSTVGEGKAPKAYWEGYGGEFLVREPTLFVAGDRGLEHVKFTPMMGGYDPARIMRTEPHDFAILEGRNRRGGSTTPEKLIISEGDQIYNYNYNGTAAAVSWAVIEERKSNRLNNAMGG